MVMDGGAGASGGAPVALASGGGGGAPGGRGRGTAPSSSPPAIQVRGPPSFYKVYSTECQMVFMLHGLFLCTDCTGC